MKETLQLTGAGALRRASRRLRTALPLRRIGLLAGTAAAALCLAALSVAGSPLPLAACVIPAVAFLPDGVFAAVGSIGGYLLFWGLPGALEPTALAVLFFAAAGIFRDTDLIETDWFFPGLCAAMAAAVGLIFLVDGGFSAAGVSLYLVKIVLSALCPVACRKLLERAAGRTAAVLLPPRREAKQPDPAPQLRKVAKVFANLNRELSDPAEVTDESEVAGVYDEAADRVCRLCVRNQLCWQTDGEQTYRWLCGAAVPMLQRGLALREDFPREFVDRCRHMEGFVTAVNQALDANACRRQLRNRLQEGRHILANQYLFLSRFLGTLAEPGREERREAAYVPDLAVSSASAGGGVSGDRGASLRDRQGNLFLLLCDGMGTGAEAAAESGKAVRTLTGLLEAGVAPDTAMEILNDFYVLQENTCFATVDLLQLSLITGDGVLYKWGAAPSYLKEGDRVTQIGTVSAPPGLAVDRNHAAQQFRLSLGGGQTLVLVSDGAYGEETEHRIGSFRSGAIRDLAAYLVAGAEERSDDDLTVLALRLAPARNSA